jgi:transposase
MSMGSVDGADQLHRDQIEFVMQHGVSINSNGGLYQHGKSYSFDKKLFVALVYMDHQERGSGQRPTLTLVATQCRVGRDFVAKVEKELNLNGRVLRPEEIFANRSMPRGPGSKSMTKEDGFVIYMLYRQNPSRSLKSYVYWLCFLTGTIVSESTVSRFFNKGFPIRGGLCMTNLVPFDKFRPGNVEKAYEYLHYLSKINPAIVKYGDEKSVKGKDVCNRKARKDVLTGFIPHTITDPDLRNHYAIIGMCSYSPQCTPIRFRITDTTVDADLFSAEIEESIAMSWLRPGDVLVLDNAAIHKGKDNSVLEEWLWKYHSVLVLFLPARSPEWNPIELVWNVLVQRLESYDWSTLSGPHKVVQASAHVLNGITHITVYKLYEKSGVFTLHGHR